MKTRHNKWNNKRTARPIASSPEKFPTIHQGFEALRSVAGTRSATTDYRSNDLISIPSYIYFLNNIPSRRELCKAITFGPMERTNGFLIKLYVA
uniref:Uncharacterized protein n=1 Tax=Trichogramma kaykai TaxID=54128 RepID=A0ABD2W4N1_9HYME